MSRVEKEECVIRLYKENKSTREIAKIMHMSFGRIAAITKKVKLEADGERWPYDLLSRTLMIMSYHSHDGRLDSGHK